MEKRASNWLATINAMVLIAGIRAHIALVFPPARVYNFDFLDNGRTRPPCGMPKSELCFLL